MILCSGFFSDLTFRAMCCVAGVVLNPNPNPNPNMAPRPRPRNAHPALWKAVIGEPSYQETGNRNDKVGFWKAVTVSLDFMGRN